MAEANPKIAAEDVSPAGAGAELDVEALSARVVQTLDELRFARGMLKALGLAAWLYTLAAVLWGLGSATWEHLPPFAARLAGMLGG